MINSFLSGVVLTCVAYDVTPLSGGLLGVVIAKQASCEIIATFDLRTREAEFSIYP